MIAWIGSLQPLLLGAVLLWSAQAKVFSRYAAAHARRTALAPLLGEDRAVLAYRTLAGVEAVLGAALVLPGLVRLEAVAATALSTGFLGYLAYAKIKDPKASCGCLSAQPIPINSRSFGRAGLMLAGSVLAVASGATWPSGLADHPVAGVALLLVEAAAIVVFSPEFDERWLMPLRRLYARLSHPLASPGAFDVPLESTVDQLHNSSAWRDLARTVTSDVREHWDEADWRVLVYSVRYAGQAASAVFAVPRLRYDPQAVRAAVVDDNGSTLAALESHPQPEYAV
ncbi:MauE/DoxX family redox-associated membrane protein [Hamadaea sp. NPDC050747]|uniref:MauE/DoxX family redox-associated membrane protein n=1 Tax=Hamadaea sp. NPDC050747 TaxID=3155789 RepID=UPI00340E28F3